MNNAIEVRFAVAGVTEVDRAFRSVEQSALRLERSTQRAYDNDARQARIAAREKERDQIRAEREQTRLRDASYRENARIAADDVKTTEKSAREKAKIEERWAKESLNYAHRASLEKQRLVEHELETEKRLREKHSRALVGAGARSVGGLVRGATGFAGTALTLGGGFVIADALKQELAATRSARQLINATTIAGPDSRATMSNIMSHASAAAMATGMSQADIISGSLAYAKGAKGGDIGGALSNMDFFAKLAKVSGTSIEDIGSAAGVLQSQNSDLAKDPAKMRQMLLAAYAQTGAGSVSLDQAAKQIGTLASTRGFFQGDQAKNQATLLALGQIAAPGGSAEEIGTYVKDFTMEIAAKRSRTSKELGFGGRGLESLGVHFDKTGRMESPEQAIEALFKATNGDITKLGGIVGKRGIPLLSQLQGEFMGAGGGEAGIAAIHKTIAGVTSASMNEDQLNAKFAEQMNDPAEKLAKSFQTLEIKVGEALLPELTKFADWLGKEDTQRELQKLIDTISGWVSWASDNPISAVVMALAAAVGKGVITQAAADALKSAITAAGSKGINLGGSLGIAAAGAVAITAEKAWIDESTKEDHDRQVGSAMLLPQAANVIADLQKNPKDPETQKKAKALIEQMKNAEGHIGDKSAFGQIASWFQSSDESKKEADENAKKFKNLAAEVDKLTAALTKATNAADAHGATNGSPGAPARNHSMSDPSRGGTK